MLGDTVNIPGKEMKFISKDTIRMVLWVCIEN
jgi:hypothetical protein